MSGLLNVFMYYTIQMILALGLAENGWLTVDGVDRGVIGYRVTGLTSEDRCQIGFAGVGDDRKNRWKLNWYRSDQIVQTPDVLYDLPEAALKVVAAIVHRGL
jgi:hypothetical protein